jgi:chemotaxis protein histidine kinase CheA
MFDTLPEVSHVETVMDGLLDSLNGSESLDLTYAQRYIIGVLDANDITRSSVTGTEGLLSDLGDGIAKMWEYIKKMFTSIWDFFFGKTNKEDSTAAKEVVKETEAAVKEVEAPKVTEENVKAVVAKVEKKVATLSEASPKKKELTKKVEELKQAEPAKAKQAAAPLIKEVFEAELLDKPKLNECAKKFKALYEELTARKEEYAKGSGDRKVLGHAIQTFLNGFTGMKEPRKGLAETKAWISWSHRCLEATDNSLETIRAMKNEHEHAIKDTQAKINGLSSSQYSKKELIEEITELKRVMASIMVIIKLAEQTRECISQMAKGIEACCVTTAAA